VTGQEREEVRMSGRADNAHVLFLFPRRSATILILSKSQDFKQEEKEEPQGSKALFFLFLSFVNFRSE